MKFDLKSMAAGVAVGVMTLWLYDNFVKPNV